MTRDMKPRRSGNGTRKKSGGSTLLGLFIGLVFGVLIAAGVVWYIHRTPPPFSARVQPPAQVAQSPTATQPAPANQTGTTAAPAAPGDQTGAAAPLALPGKPGDPMPAAGDKPRFDFYKILPGNNEAVPDAKPPATAKSGEPKAPDANKEKDGKESKDTLLKEPVYLQAGSFQNAGDADNQKAKLAMLGVEAAIQQVMLQDKVWYRVRLGPFRKVEEVNALRADLARQGVEANVVKKD